MNLEKENLPKHIAIIMDGNRRWAKAKGKPAGFGHKEGAKVLERIVRYANKIGIENITVYAFSTENWKRAKDEVSTLMALFQSYLDDYSKRADSENIKVKIIGSRKGLSEKMISSIAICGGSGAEDIEQLAGKVDAYITGDTKHRHAKYAIDHDCLLIDPGHHLEVIIEEKLPELKSKRENLRRNFHKANSSEEKAEIKN